MKFLEILGLSVAATLGMLFFACVTAWLCTFTIGSWLVLAFFAAFIIFICVEGNENKPLSHLLWKEILPICPGVALMLAFFWFVGQLMTDKIIEQASIGFNIVWGVLTVISCVAACFALAFVFQFLESALSAMFSKKRNRSQELLNYACFTCSLLCNLGITAAVMYYILYPIGLA